MAELRGVVAYLQSKLGGLEKELHSRREEEGDLRAELAASQAEVAQVRGRLGETERDKAELVSLVEEVNNRPTPPPAHLDGLLSAGGLNLQVLHAGFGTH